jgi:hypothetical protein
MFMASPPFTRLTNASPRPERKNLAVLLPGFGRLLDLFESQRLDLPDLMPAGEARGPSGNSSLGTFHSDSYTAGP